MNLKVVYKTIKLQYYGVDEAITMNTLLMHFNQSIVLKG